MGLSVVYKKIVEIPTCHTSQQSIVTELIPTNTLTNQSQKADAIQSGGHVSYPTDSPNATRLWLFSSLPGSRFLLRLVSGGPFVTSYTTWALIRFVLNVKWNLINLFHKIDPLLKCKTMNKQQTALSCAFSSLWPSDAKWQHRSKSSLAQVMGQMACCLTAPSHYPN